MKVLNVCLDDYANYMYTNMVALRSIGIDCEAFKVIPHPFSYKHEANIASLADIKAMECDVLQVFHTGTEFMDMNAGKRIVYHTGTKYRNGADVFDEMFKGWISVADLPELARRTDYFISMTVDTDAIQPDYTYKGGVVAHYPSHKETKGTDEILRRVPGIICDRSNVPHMQNLKRMNECDIYVEMHAPTLFGRAHGNFSTTTLEAAALGKIVVSMCDDFYREKYCDPPIFGIEDIPDLLAADHNTLYNMKKESRKWVERYHSIPATARRIKEVVCG